MAIKDQILEFLKNNRSLKEIRSRFKSGSSLYNALNEYFPWAEDQVKRLSESILELENKVRQLKEDKAGLIEEKKSLKSTVSSLESQQISLF